MNMTHSLLLPLASASLLLAATQTAQAVSLSADVGASVDAATQAVSDTALTASIKTKLAADSRVKASSISVTTTNHVAVLTGTAPSHEAKMAAEDLALNVEGVSRVDNRIEAPSAVATMGAEMKSGAMQAGEKVTDGWITTKVKSQLVADELTKAGKIKVSTKDNIVMLSGTAGSEAEKTQAIKLAMATEGVKKVDSSQLKIVAKISSN